MGDIWGFSASDVWAATKDGVLHFDGTEWTVQDASISGDAIWGSAPNDIWLTRNLGGQVFHFDGVSWQDADTGGGQVSALTGSAANNVWIVSFYAAEVRRFDGAVWSTLPALPAPDPVTAFTLGSDVGWVGVQHTGQVFEWDGATWSEISTGLDVIETIWASSANDVFIGGSISSSAAAVHYDGSTVSPLTLPDANAFPGRVSRIWGLGPNDVWLGTEFGGIAHFSNGNVSSVPSPLATPTFGWLNGFWGSSSGDVWAAIGSTNNGGWITHWDGAAWSKSGLLTETPLSDVWGAAWDDTWAVTGEGTLLHFDGKEWSLKDELAGSTPPSIWGRSACDVWLTNGGLWHYDGAAWSAVPNAPGKLADVWGVPSGKLWLAATDEVLRYDGTTFESFVPIGLGPFEPLRRVWSSGDDTVFALSGEQAFRYDGTSWTQYPLGDELFAIWGTSDTDVWIGGSSATHHFDGTSWTEDSSARANTFWGCDDTLYAGDYGGNVSRRDGDTWTPLEIGDSPIHGLFGVSPNHVLAVGGFGGIRRLGK